MRWDQLRAGQGADGSPILPSRRAHNGKGTRGTRQFPGHYRTLGISYFPFAIPTQCFEVKAVPNKIMLDAELPITSTVGSRNRSLGQEPGTGHSGACLTCLIVGGVSFSAQLLCRK